MNTFRGISVLTRNSKYLVVAAVCSSFLSFLVFNNCKVRHGWSQPRNYCRLGYTDIQELFVARGLIDNIFPYDSPTNSFEYPPIIGVGNWLLSFLVPASQPKLWFFVLNMVIISAIYVVSCLVLWRIRPQSAYLFVVCPPLILTLFTNWDMWVVVSALLSIYYFDRNRLKLSAFWLGFSISTKFFPIVFLLPICIILIRRGSIKSLANYLTITFIVLVLINVPIVLTNYEGWRRFFTLNQNRGLDLGSIYLALSYFNIEIPRLNLVYEIISVVFFILYSMYVFRLKFIPNLSQVAFFSVFIFTTFSKVYSPQYILWLAALACIAMSSKKLIGKYWFWQSTEIFYYLILQIFFANSEHQNLRLFEFIYAAAIIFRVIGISVFCQALLREIARENATQLS
jgi:uncharacterized membrane protein